MQGLSPYIYGIHDPGGESILAGKGQVLISESIGADADSVQGADYTHLAQQGLGVIVRLNDSHHGQGTIPLPAEYADFAATCARFVAQSQGCVIWIIGNEPNHPVERPQGKLITPQEYAACFRLCRDAIKQVGNEHQVLPAAVGPWNAETKYPGNESGNWVQYFADMLHHCGECDGLTLHAYTRGASPAMVFSEERMDAPFQHRHYSFRTYQDFLNAVPASLRHLPVLITEIDEYDAWVDANTGVVRAIYQEIDAWNQSGGQPILAGVLYRWLNHDQWGFQHKEGVKADLRAAVDHNFQAPQGKVTQADEQERKVYIPSIANGKVAPVAALPPRQWDGRLTQRGIELTEYRPKPGETYMRLVKGEYWEEKEHTFVETLGKDGTRLPDMTVRFWWDNGNHDQEQRKITERKPHDHWMVDFPMFSAGRSYGLEVLGYPSDRVFGMGLGSVEQPDWNIHVSYKFVFKLTVAPDVSQPEPQEEQPITPLPQPEPPPHDVTQAWLVTALARVLGIEPRLAQAFLQVESGGHSFVNGRLVIRFEAHLFRDYLHNDAWFAQHFRYDQAEPWQDQQWRRKPSDPWQPVHVAGSFAKRQAAEWEVFEFAAGMNRDAALRSISMGSAQIMGFNHRTVGYESPDAMFADYSASALNQVVGLFAYCHNRPGLVAAMQRKDWRGMAERYNGSGAVDFYARELERVYNELGD